MIKALTVHAYLGGLNIGIGRNPNIQMLGSMESWKPAVTWAPKLGVNVISNGVVPRANYVASNPPCSRFSPMSYSKFDNNMREDLGTFEEMQETLLTAKYAEAELVHVESGPLMFNCGDNLIDQFNDILQWPEFYIFMLKVCTSHAGLPQLRPRTHVFIAKRPFPEIDLTPVQLPVNIGEFMHRWDSEYNFEPVPSSVIPDPIVYAAVQQHQAVFLSTRPKIISEYDQKAYSVVSSRHFAWLEQKRWWSVDEYAAVQGYDANGFDYSEPGVPLAMALISKSVSPSIAEYLSHRVVLPYFEVAERNPHGPIKVNLT